MNSNAQTLAEAYVPFALSAANRVAWRLRRPDLRGDLRSAAQFGLVRAARRFDPDRGIRLGTYARRDVFGAMASVLRDDQTRRRQFDAIPVDTAPNLEFHHEGFDQIDSLDWVEGQLRKLPERLARTMRLLYVEGLPQREVARRVGVDQTTVSYQHAKAIEILRERLTPCPIS